LIVADRESPRDGRFLEAIGNYNPRTVPSTVVVDEARLYHWLKQGAQPSESVMRILRSSGAWGRWERVKGGEGAESVLSEAKSSMAAADARTRRDDVARRKPSKRAEAKSAEKEEPTAEAGVE
jgi:small subunit ribosomal protein S16